MSTNVDLALVKGARDAAPKFADIGGAVGKAVATGETAFAAIRQEQRLQRFEKERELQIMQKGYDEHGELNTEDTPEEYMSQVQKYADHHADLVSQLEQNRKNMDPGEYLDAKRNLKKELGVVQKGLNNLKEYKKYWVEIQDNEGLSDALRGEARKKINDLVVNNMNPPVFKDGQMFYQTKDGELINSNDLPEIRSKAAPEHLKFMDFGSNFIDEVAKTDANAILNNKEIPEDYLNQLTARFQSADLGLNEAESMAIDFLKLGGEFGEVTAIYDNLKQGVAGAVDIFQFDKDGNKEIDEYEYTAAMQNLFSLIREDEGGVSKNEFIKQVKNEYLQVAKRAWTIKHDNARKAQDAALAAQRAKAQGSANASVQANRNAFALGVDMADSINESLSSIIEFAQINQLQNQPIENTNEINANMWEVKNMLSRIKGMPGGMIEIEKVYDDGTKELPGIYIRDIDNDNYTVEWNPKMGMESLVNQIQNYMIRHHEGDRENFVLKGIYDRQKTFKDLKESLANRSGVSSVGQEFLNRIKGK
jgi:hypothetical protein